jgi:hypothetical protein
MAESERPIASFSDERKTGVPLRRGPRRDKKGLERRAWGRLAVQGETAS